jgi:hypothetical protein
MAPSLSKFSVCYKDCQSGKTFEQFLRVRKQMQEGKKYFYIFFTDNFKLQSSQLNKRFREEFPDKGLPIQLNSGFKYSTRQRREIPVAEQNCAEYHEVANILLDCPNRDTLMVLSNAFRTEDLTGNLTKWCRAGGYDGVQVWFDEIDRTTSLFSETIPALNDHPDVVGIVGMTGTGLQKLFEDLKVHELSLLPVSTPHENFMGFNEHQFRNVEMDLDDTKLFSSTDDYTGYASKVLSKERFVKPGVSLFVPSHPWCDKQHNMKSLLMAYKFDVVVLVNGEERVLYRRVKDTTWGPEDYDRILNILGNGPEADDEINRRLGQMVTIIRSCYDKFDLSDDSELPLEQSLAKISRENNWKGLSVAVTGHKCVTRGVTLQSKDFVFTHAILPLLFTINASDAENVSARKRADDYYQLCARINGSTRVWNGDVGVKVYTSAESQAFLQGYCNIPQTLAQRCPKLVVKGEQYAELLTSVFQYVDNVAAKNRPPPADSGIPIRFTITNPEAHTAMCHKYDDKGQLNKAQRQQVHEGFALMLRKGLVELDDPNAIEFDPSQYTLSSRRVYREGQAAYARRFSQMAAANADSQAYSQSVPAGSYAFDIAEVDYKYKDYYQSKMVGWITYAPHAPKQA